MPTRLFYQSVSRPALLGCLCFSLAAAAAESLDIPQRPGSAEGAWQAGAAQRKAKAEAGICRHSPAADVLVRAKALAAAKQLAAAVRCLDAAHRTYPANRQIAELKAALVHAPLAAVAAAGGTAAHGRGDESAAAAYGAAAEHSEHGVQGEHSSHAKRGDQGEHGRQSDRGDQDEPGGHGEGGDGEHDEHTAHGEHGASGDSEHPGHGGSGDGDRTAHGEHGASGDSEHPGHGGSGDHTAHGEHGARGDSEHPGHGGSGDDTAHGMHAESGDGADTAHGKHGASGDGEPDEHGEHRAHGEHGGASAEHGDEEAPQYRAGLTYLHSAKDEEKVTDTQVLAEHNWDQSSLRGSLHLLAKSSPEEEAAADKLLDVGYAQTFAKDRLGLLLGHSFDKGKVSYRNMFGLRYERLFRDEAAVGAQARSLSFEGGKSLAFTVDGKMHLVDDVMGSLRMDVLSGEFKGSAASLQLSYEHAGLELAAFITKGHGVPSHPYLRPTSTDAFTTLGAEAEQKFWHSWSLSIGLEQRREATGKEAEFSIGLAWEH